MAKKIAGTLSYFCVTCGLFKSRSSKKAIAHAYRCRDRKNRGVCSCCGFWQPTSYEVTRRNLCWACFNSNILV